MLVSAESVAEVQDAVRGAGTLLPRSGGSKPALSQSADTPDLTVLDVSRLSGLIEYDPAELTFTAHAATPLLEVRDALARHGQYLPFDPPRVLGGATLAGAVAAATSGAGAFRHGGVRDFVIGVSLVDGRGRLVAGGGRVVKNAAGFDLPKLMVGSIGRLGVMVRLSFKVFPRPRATTTLAFPTGGADAAVATIAALGRGPMALDALDLTRDGRLLVQLGGAPQGLDARASRLARRVGREYERLDGADERTLWQAAAEFTWAEPDAGVVRVALIPAGAPGLLRTLAALGVPVRLSLGANLAWVAWPRVRPLAELDLALTELGLPGLSLDRGGAGPLLGPRRGGAFAERIRAALDPDDRFLPLAQPTPAGEH